VERAAPRKRGEQVVLGRVEAFGAEQGAQHAVQARLAVATKCPGKQLRRHRGEQPLHFRSICTTS
jgi:hypothetical protein